MTEFMQVTSHGLTQIGRLLLSFATQTLLGSSLAGPDLLTQFLFLLSTSCWTVLLAGLGLLLDAPFWPPCLPALLWVVGKEGHLCIQIPSHPHTLGDEQTPSLKINRGKAGHNSKISNILSWLRPGTESQAWIDWQGPEVQNHQMMNWT